MKSALKRLTPATVVAMIALFVALGGTSYAVAKLPADGVRVGPNQRQITAAPRLQVGHAP